MNILLSSGHVLSKHNLQSQTNKTYYNIQQMNITSLTTPSTVHNSTVQITGYSIFNSQYFTSNLLRHIIKEKLAYLQHNFIKSWAQITRYLLFPVISPWYFTIQHCNAHQGTSHNKNQLNTQDYNTLDIQLSK